MLYDFHKYQNAQKANSVHATYLLFGTKASQADGDVEMTSSMPEHEPLSETVPTTALTLAREENLTGIPMRRSSYMATSNFVQLPYLNIRLSIPFTSTVLLPLRSAIYRFSRTSLNH